MFDRNLETIKEGIKLGGNEEEISDIRKIKGIKDNLALLKIMQETITCLVSS